MGTGDDFNRGAGWSAPGLDQRAGLYPLRVEAHIFAVVDRLAPGVTSVVRFARYYALYAALAAHAQRKDLDADACRRLLRRSEVLMAAASIAEERAGDGPASAHGVDRIEVLDDGINVATAADEGQLKSSYSPRLWGFWEDYRGPSSSLDTVITEGGVLRPGRHECPTSVIQFFEPLFEAVFENVVSTDRLGELRPFAVQSATFPEGPWLRGPFTATDGDGTHDPDAWQPDDRRRRSALRMIGRTTELYGDRADLSWEEVVRRAVAFGDRPETDPLLRDIPEILSWRGLLLRHYSVNAWRRLWAGLVRSIGRDEEGDSTRDDLRSWLADPMDDVPLREFMSGLPATTASGHPAAAERQVLEDGDSEDQRTNVALLLVGARRARELTGEARTVFLGKPEILNPEWVMRRAEDFQDRPMRDFAVQLVEDMLAQAQRVALAKMRPDKSGRLRVFSRVHERNGRFYKTSDEGSGDLGLRISQLADFAWQFGLIDITEEGVASMTDTGHRLLELGS
ncbi:hypothetical protein GCM10029978_110310 [Actinoallomurus acanthiterrae]